MAEDVPGQGQQAGRLELPVVADLSGFRRDLREKLKAATEGIEAKIGVEIDSAGLREKLEAVVEEAAAGVKAKVRVDIDARQARRGLKGLFGREKVKVGVDTKGTIVDDVAAATEAAQVEAEANPVEVPVTGKNKLRARLLAWIAEAQMEAAARPVEVPVKVKAPRGRALFRGALIGSFLALLQPAVAAIGGLLSGVVALGNPLGQAVGSLANAVPLLSAFVGIGATGMVAFNGFGGAIAAMVKQEDALANGTKLTAQQQAKLNQAMDQLSPSALKVARALVGLRKETKGFRKGIQEALFSQIDPAGMKAGILTVLDAVRAPMQGIAGELGKLINGVFNDLGTTGSESLMLVLEDVQRFLTAAGPGIRAFFRGTLVLLSAMSPILTRLGQALTVFGNRFEGWSKRKYADGGILAFLNRATTRASQFGRIVRDLAGGLVGIFKGGAHAGDLVTGSIERNAKKFNDWANSTKGQQSIKDYFDSMLPTFYQMVGLIGDIGKALFRMSKDPATAKLIEKIRDKLVPALEKFFTVLGHDLGPKVIDLLSDLAQTFANLGGAGGGIADVVTIIDDLARAVNSFLSIKVGGKTFGDVLGQILGMFVAYKAAKGVGKFLGLAGLASGLASLGTGAVAKGMSVLARLVGLGGLGKVLGDFAGGGRPGRGGKSGKTVEGGLKGFFREMFGKRMEVYWKLPQTVKVLGGGLPGGGPDVDLPGDKDGKGKPKGKGARRAVAAETARRVASKVLPKAKTATGVGTLLLTSGDSIQRERSNTEKEHIAYASFLKRAMGGDPYKNLPRDLQALIQKAAGLQANKDGRVTGVGKYDFVTAYDFLAKYGRKTSEVREVLNNLAKDPAVVAELNKRAAAAKRLTQTLVDDAKGKGTTAGKGFTSNLTTALTGGLPLVRGAGDKQGTAAADAAKGKGTTAGKSWISSFLAKLAAGIPQANATGQRTGAAVAQGLQSGSSGGILSRVLGWAKNIGRRFAEAVKHGADVHSPSRITTWVGRQVANGLGVGIQQRHRHQVRLARKLGRAVAHATGDALGQGTFRPGSLRAGQGLRNLPPAAAAAGPTALVGGNLELNLPEGDPSRILDAALFELRRIARGGVYVAGSG